MIHKESIFGEKVQLRRHEMALQTVQSNITCMSNGLKVIF